jgi:HPt (histidine-containing phosphotransfer) domain-containing protein
MAKPAVALSPLRKIYESFLSVAHETLDTLARLTERPATERSAKEPPAGAKESTAGTVVPGDSTMLARRLHTLLGSAGMVGARQVERVTATLAEAVKAGRHTELESGGVLVAQAVRRFEEELERRLAALTR